jgi:hypothetical protein
LKGFVTLLVVLTSLVVAYYKFEAKLNLPPLWAALLCLGALVAFILIFFLPEFLDQLKLERMRVEGIHGRLKDPTYFRLTPYEAGESFKRFDAAVEAANKWISNSSLPIHYLTGQSGAGKSSLINAAITPALEKSGWVVVTLRPHDDPLGAISKALLRPNTIWERPPAAPANLRELVERAAERVRKAEKRLLLVIDQFEETLILSADAVKAGLRPFLLGLVEKPVAGLTVLLSLRSEYVKDLEEIGLPPRADGQGQNTFEVGPFKRSDAQTFIEKSGLQVGEGLLDKVLEEAAEIEDMPDKVRPIVLNMFGLVISSFKGTLPKGVEAGRLLSGYVEGSLKKGGGFAIRVLQPLVTYAGTKRTLTIERIAAEAKLPPLEARGCLIPLANDGLVRRLGGTPERWEVAHDFIARLLQPSLRNWRKSAWEAMRPWLLPASLAIWLAALGGAIFFYPGLHDEYIISRLRKVGLVSDASVNGGATFKQNGTPIFNQTRFWRIASLMTGLSYPVVGLSFQLTDLTSLQGMPALPALTSLNLSSSGLMNLQGMPALPALTSLDLSSSSIESLQGMPALPALTSLDLSSSGRLISLQGMPALPALTSLNLTFTQELESLQGMPALPALTSLNLSDNSYLKSLGNLPNLPELRSIYLVDTYVSDWEKLSSLPNLQGITVSRRQYDLVLPSIPADLRAKLFDELPKD